MKKAPPTKRELMAEILLEFPDEPNRTIARIAHERLPNAFPSLDLARNVVRSLRGARGDRYISDKRFVRPIGWQVDVLPKSKSQPRKPFVITGPVDIAVMGDLHIPYHDTTAIGIMVDFLLEAKPDIIFINGDLGDFYATSRHEKDPRRSMAEELDTCRQFLFWLRQRFPKTRIIYKQGNHETNIERYLIRQAPVLLGVSDFELPVLLRFDELGIEHVGPLQLVCAGKLPIYHGHELPQGMSSPVNPARGIWMRVQETMMCNHWHRTSEHTETTGVSKKVTSCWSLGCLCDLSPDYAIVNKWNHGFAMVEVLDKAGNFEVRNHKILNGKVY
jgi:hypothetical protein